MGLYECKREIDNSYRNEISYLYKSKLLEMVALGFSRALLSQYVKKDY